MIKNQDKIPTKALKIAKEIRKWGEKEDKKVMNEGDLSCLCEECSSRIYKKLLRMGFDPIYAHNIWHCFVILDGWIIDVTATQFGEKEKIFIRKYGKLKSKFWKDAKLISSQKNKL